MIDDVSDMCYSGGYFYGSNYGKFVGSLLYESLKYNALTLVHLFGDRSSVYQCLKVTKGGVSVGVSVSAGLGGGLLNISGICNADVIKFGIDDVSDMDSYRVSFI